MSLDKKLRSKTELLWINDHSYKAGKESVFAPVTKESILADYKLFAILSKLITNDEIKSGFASLKSLHQGLMPAIAGSIPGHWVAKLDSDLPVAGSVKARGGMFEILNLAVNIASEHGIDLVAEAQTTPIEELNAKISAIFSEYTVCVGSTGNLGLSIGISSRILGFKVKVFMSRDAKEWKMELLREYGAEVFISDEDYSKAVEIGRAEAELDPKAYFVDDERSELLYRGYATAAVEVANFLDDIEKDSPVFVYLPCGVGGAPAGIAAGLKAFLGSQVHIMLAEPTEAASVLVGLSDVRDMGKPPTVYEYGMSNLTVADGLAVAQASVGALESLGRDIAGCYTVCDNKMSWLMYAVNEYEQIRVEPSGAASLNGPIMLYYTKEGFDYLKNNNLMDRMGRSVHISWFTGGSLLPDEVYKNMIEEAKKCTIDF